MGDRPLIPLPDAIKTKIDVGVVSTTAAGTFQAIPWNDIAAFLSCVYLLVRLIDWAWDKWKNK